MVIASAGLSCRVDPLAKDALTDWVVVSIAVVSLILLLTTGAGRALDYPGGSAHFSVRICIGRDCSHSLNSRARMELLSPPGAPGAPGAQEPYEPQRLQEPYEPQRPQEPYEPQRLHRAAYGTCRLLQVSGTAVGR